MGLADTRTVSVDAKTASRSSSDIDGDAGERIRVIIIFATGLLLLSYLSRVLMRESAAAAAAARR